MSKFYRSCRNVACAALTLAVGIGVLVAGTGPAAYRIEDLGTFGGPDGCENGVHPTWSYARGLNESGDVVGHADRSVQLLDPDTGEPLHYPDTGHAVCTVSLHAALWRDGEIVDPGVLMEGGSAVANRVNDHEQVVGQARANRNAAHPYLWTEEDGMADLLEDEPNLSGTSWGINNFGEITFTANAAYFRDVNGDKRVIKFPDSPGNGNGEAFEINDDGIVAGHAIPPGDWQPQAFRYDSRADVVENIHDPFYRRSYAYGVNPQGDIAARMVAYTGHGFASVSTTDGDLVVLPLGNIREQGVLRPDLLLGGVDDVNALGDVLGTDVSAAPLPPVAWVAFDVFGEGPIEKIPLEELLSPKDQAEWDIQWAWEMNDARQFAGRGVHNGVTRAFLMTPDDTASNEDDGNQATAESVSAGVPVAVNRSGIDPVTGLEGVKNFVPDGMGPNRVAGSLRPRSTIEPHETDGVQNVEPVSGRAGPTSRGSRRAPGLIPRDTNPGEDPEPFDRNSEPTTRDDG